MNWNHTMQIDGVCAYRTRNITMTSRQKSIVRTRTVKYSQVHDISLGRSLFINHIEDMVMIHIKKQSIKDNPTPIINNPFVKHALTKELFGCIVYSIASSLYRKKIYILDKAVVFFSKYTKLDGNDAKKPRRTSTFCRHR